MGDSIGVEPDSKVSDKVIWELKKWDVPLEWSLGNALLSMLLFSIVGMILTVLITKLAFAALGWFTIWSFDITREDIIYAAKLGFAGGSILGVGWVLFYISRVKFF